MITVTAMKWAPPFAAGQVRDHRVRWILNEVGWPYNVKLVDAPTMNSAAYRKLQPFGQLPVLEEDGRPALFESGAIVIDVATRADRFIAADGPERAQVLAWTFAALNTVEPTLQQVAEVEYFLEDDAQKELRRPLVAKAAKQRLAELSSALGDRDWLVGDDFTIADLMTASVLKIAKRLRLLSALPSLAVWHDRVLARPAHVKAEADQIAQINAHTQKDMRYGASE